MKYLHRQIITNLVLSLIAVVNISAVGADDINKYIISSKADLLSNIVNESGELCSNKDKICYFINPRSVVGDVVFKKTIIWDFSQSLFIKTKNNIIFEESSRLILEGDGELCLKAGMEPGEREVYKATVEFRGKGSLEALGKSKIRLYLNPISEDKYLNPNIYYYREHIKINREVGANIFIYMLVNDVFDLQNMRLFLSGNYALSQDMNAEITNDVAWGVNNNGSKGFIPISYGSKRNDSLMPFSGNFDGNGYTIRNLYVNGSDSTTEESGLFGRCQGRTGQPTMIENFTIDKCKVEGVEYTGVLAGVLINVDVSNVNIANSEIKSGTITGLLAGSVYNVTLDNIAIFFKGNSLPIFGVDIDEVLHGYSLKSCKDEDTLRSNNFSVPFPYNLDYNYFRITHNELIRLIPSNHWSN